MDCRREVDEEAFLHFVDEQPRGAAGLDDRGYVGLVEELSGERDGMDCDARERHYRDAGLRSPAWLSGVDCGFRSFEAPPGLHSAAGAAAGASTRRALLRLALAA